METTTLGTPSRETYKQARKLLESTLPEEEYEHLRDEDEPIFLTLVSELARILLCRPPNGWTAFKIFDSPEVVEVMQANIVASNFAGPRSRMIPWLFWEYGDRVATFCVSLQWFQAIHTAYDDCSLLDDSDASNYELVPDDPNVIARIFHDAQNYNPSGTPPELLNGLRFEGRNFLFATAE